MSSSSASSYRKDLVLQGSIQCGAGAPVSVLDAGEASVAAGNFSGVLTAAPTIAAFRLTTLPGVTANFAASGDAIGDVQLTTTLGGTDAGSEGAALAAVGDAEINVDIVIDAVADRLIRGVVQYRVL